MELQYSSLHHMHINRSQYMLYIVIIDDACRRDHLSCLCFLGARLHPGMTLTSVCAYFLGPLALDRRLPIGLKRVVACESGIARSPCDNEERTQ